MRPPKLSPSVRSGGGSHVTNSLATVCFVYGRHDCGIVVVSFPAVHSSAIGVGEMKVWPARLVWLVFAIRLAHTN